MQTKIIELTLGKEIDPNQIIEITRLLFQLKIKPENVVDIDINTFEFYKEAIIDIIDPINDIEFNICFIIKESK